MCNKNICSKTLYCNYMITYSSTIKVMMYLKYDDSENVINPRGKDLGSLQQRSVQTERNKDKHKY